MSVYTVVSAEQDGGFKNAYGTYRCWKLDLRGADGEFIEGVGMNQKMLDDGTYKSAPSGELDLEVTTDQQGRKKAKRPYNGGGSTSPPQNHSGTSPHSGSSKPQEDPDLRQKRIVRQHSQEMAIRLLSAGKTLEGVDLLKPSHDTPVYMPSF